MIKTYLTALFTWCCVKSFRKIRIDTHQSRTISEKGPAVVGAVACSIEFMITYGGKNRSEESMRTPLFLCLVLKDIRINTWK